MGYEKYMKYLFIVALLTLASCSSKPKVEEEAANPENGYVKFVLDVSESGHPINPKIVDSFPPGKFDKLAMKAIYKWTFIPEIVDGQGVVQKGIRYTMDFKLDKP